MPLASGDSVVFYTDGVTEAEAPGGEFLGEERLATCVGRADGAEPMGLVDSLLGEVRAWRGRENHGLTDDITIVAVRFDGDLPAM